MTWRDQDFISCYGLKSSLRFTRLWLLYVSPIAMYREFLTRRSLHHRSFYVTTQYSRLVCADITIQWSWVNIQHRTTLRINTGHIEIDVMTHRCHQNRKRIYFCSETISRTKYCLGVSAYLFEDRCLRHAFVSEMICKQVSYVLLECQIVFVYADSETR